MAENKKEIERDMTSPPDFRFVSNLPFDITC